MFPYINIWSPKRTGPGVDQQITAKVSNIENRLQFNSVREAVIRKYGMNIPQEVNDALTRKHLELNGKHE